MTRLIIPALVALLVSGPAWAGSSEIKDCEDEIRSKLKFPGSYKKEHVIKDESNEKPHTFIEKDGSASGLGTLFKSEVEIEFTVLNENNQVQRRVGVCILWYEPGSIFSAKKLVMTSAIIKYDP